MGSFGNANWTRVQEAVLENNDTKLRNVLLQIDSQEDSDVVAIVNQKQHDVHLMHLCLGHVLCVRALLQFGAKVDVTNNEGLQAIHLAVQRDFVETVMMLVQYGAGLNTQTTDITPKTPIELASEFGSQTSEDYLLFSAVNLPDNLLSKENEMKHKIMMKGIENKKVAVGGLVVTGSAIQHYTNVKSKDGTDIGIGIHSSSDFVFQVRRLEVDYQSSSIRIAQVPMKEGMKLISDIYQYKVDLTTTCNVRIPIYGTEDNRYTETIVVQTTEDDDVCRNVRVKDNHVEIEGILLQSHGLTPIVSFGVFASNRVDEAVIEFDPKNPNRTHVIESTVERTFKVLVPPSMAPRDHRLNIEVKVIKAETPDPEESGDTGSNISDMGYHSDFCSVRDATQSSTTTATSGYLSAQSSLEGSARGSRQNSAQTSHSDSSGDASRPSSAISDLVNIQLPKPPAEQHLHVAVFKCPQGANPADTGSWDEESHMDSQNQHTVSVKRTGFGDFIVVNVRKISYLVKEGIRDMWEMATGNKVKCVIFTMTRQVQQQPKYDVLVVLCLDKDVKRRQTEKERLNYKMSEFGATDAVEMYAKTTYMIKLVSKFVTINDPDTLPIQYQGDKPKSREFTVQLIPNKQELASLYCFKRDVPKKPSDFGRKSKLSMPIRFSTIQPNTVPEDGFCSDKFIDKIAVENVGMKWYELGIFLGLSCEELDLYENFPLAKRNSKILKNWRDKNQGQADLGLEVMFWTLKKIELPKLRKRFLEEVRRCQDKDTSLRNWLGKYRKNTSSTDETFDFTSMNTTDRLVSPFSDQFLLLLSNKLAEDDTFYVQLGIGSVDLKAAAKFLPDIRRRCHLLYIARNRPGDEPPLRFSETLVKVLKRFNLNLVLYEEIIPVVQNCESCSTHRGLSAKLLIQANRSTEPKHVIDTLSRIYRR